MPALEGELGLISLSGLLQMLQGERVTGRLKLVTGHLDLLRGKVVGAAYHGLDGESALMELFVYANTGPFSLDAEHQPSGESLGDIVHLIMDGCRISDEWKNMREFGVSLSDGAPIPEWVQRVEAELRAGYPLVWISEQRQVPAVDLAEAVQELMELGEAQLTEPNEPPIDLDYWGALELGRESYRNQDWLTAQRAFQVALDRRPGDRIATQNLHAAQQRAGGSR